MANSYDEALQEAKAALDDIKERGNEAISEEEWNDVEKELYSPEEIAASDIRVAIAGIFIKARNAGLTFDQVEAITKEAFEAERELETVTA